MNTYMSICYSIHNVLPQHGMIDTKETDHTDTHWSFSTQCPHTTPHSLHNSLTHCSLVIQITMSSHNTHWLFSTQCPHITQKITGHSVHNVLPVHKVLTQSLVI